MPIVKVSTPNVTGSMNPDDFFFRSEEVVTVTYDFVRATNSVPEHGLTTLFFKNGSNLKVQTFGSEANNSLFNYLERELSK
jgi:hypothetical protein